MARATPACLVPLSLLVAVLLLHPHLLQAQLSPDTPLQPVKTAASLPAMVKPGAGVAAAAAAAAAAANMSAGSQRPTPAAAAAAQPAGPAPKKTPLPTPSAVAAGAAVGAAAAAAGRATARPQASPGQKASAATSSARKRAAATNPAGSLHSVLAKNTPLFRSLWTVLDIAPDQVPAGAVGTVFAPTDEAIADFLQGMNLTAKQLSARPELVDMIVSYHFVPGYQVQGPADVANGSRVLLTGDEQYILTLGSTTAGSKKKLVLTDVQKNTANVVDGPFSVRDNDGLIVYVIDRVLKSANYFSNLTSALGHYPYWIAAKELVLRSGLLPQLERQAVTLLVPDSSAVKPLEANISRASPGRLADILRYHVVPKVRRIPKGFETGTVGTLLKGHMLDINSTSERIKDPYSGNRTATRLVPVVRITPEVGRTAKVNFYNIFAGPGILQGIDQLLLPDLGPDPDELPQSPEDEEPPDYDDPSTTITNDDSGSPADDEEVMMTAAATAAPAAATGPAAKAPQTKPPTASVGPGAGAAAGARGTTGAAATLTPGSPMQPQMPAGRANGAAAAAGTAAANGGSTSMGGAAAAPRPGQGIAGAAAVGPAARGASSNVPPATAQAGSMPVAAGASKRPPTQTVDAGDDTAGSRRLQQQPPRPVVEQPLRPAPQPQQQPKANGMPPGVPSGMPADVRAGMAAAPAKLASPAVQGSPAAVRAAATQAPAVRPKPATPVAPSGALASAVNVGAVGQLQSFPTGFTTSKTLNALQLSALPVVPKQYVNRYGSFKGPTVKGGCLNCKAWGKPEE